MVKHVACVGFVVGALGLQACSSEPGGSAASSDSGSLIQSTSATSEEPTPAPKPEVDLRVTDRTVYSDAVTLKGSVRPKTSKVSINGERVEVSHGHWAMPVTLTRKGDTGFHVKAKRKGFVSDTVTQTITRELSSAERAVIRQKRAARRAGARALASAENYLELSGFSKQGLYEQLSSSYGEGFTESEAQYAVDHVHADWNHEAVESAKNYLDTSPMSKAALIDQLSSSYGEGFTYEQATYAVNKVY